MKQIIVIIPLLATLFLPARSIDQSTDRLQELHDSLQPGFENEQLASARVSEHDSTFLDQNSGRPILMAADGLRWAVLTEHHQLFIGEFGDGASAQRIETDLSNENVIYSIDIDANTILIAGDRNIIQITPEGVSRFRNIYRFSDCIMFNGNILTKVRRDTLDDVENFAVELSPEATILKRYTWPVHETSRYLDPSFTFFLAKLGPESFALSSRLNGEILLSGVAQPVHALGDSTAQTRANYNLALFQARSNGRRLPELSYTSVIWHMLRGDETLFVTHRTAGRLSWRRFPFSATDQSWCLEYQGSFLGYFTEKNTLHVFTYRKDSNSILTLSINLYTGNKQQT